MKSTSVPVLDTSRTAPRMRHISHLIAGAVLALAVTAAAPAFADCRDQVRELREEINDGRNGYSPASRIEAKRHLAAAELTIMQPLECRIQLRQARQALQPRVDD
jgi:hypothetical protein